MYHLEPRFLPDNRHFLFFAVNQRTSDSAIYEGSTDSAQVQRVMANAVGPVYFVGQDLLFVRDSTLMAQKFDWKNARLLGAPVSLQEHVYANSSSYEAVAAFSASDNVLAYYPEGHPDTQLVWLDRRGNRISTLGPVAQYTNPSLSPDEKRIAVGIHDPAINQRDIWIFDASGGSTRLTNDPKDDFNPLWSPEGRRIAFVSDRKGVRDLFIKNATPSSPEELLLSTQAQKAIESWSPDGKFIVYNNQTSIQAIPVDGEHKPFLAVDGPGFCDQGAISPDGKWIAYRSHDAGAVEVNIEAFPRGGTHGQVSTNGGGEPSWRRDGKELYFVRDKQLLAVDIDVVAGGIVHGPPKLLFTAPLTLEIRRNRYVPSADGQRFLIVAQSEQRGLGAHIVMNWRSALNRK